MAIETPAQLLLQDQIRAFAEQLEQAPHGHKGVILEQVKQQLGWSRDTFYRKLKDIGWKSCKKRRSDAGKTSVDSRSLEFIEAARQQSVRKNGKITMPATVAIGIAHENGMAANASPSTVNRLLRARNSNNAALRRAAPTTKMRSLHPNHVHQVDPSLCLIYYMPGGKQYIMEEDKFYKNKLENFAKIKLKCWRYVLTDHLSATVIVRYYAAKGESSENMWDFLCYAWRKQEGRTFHGVPSILYWDKGSANTAGAIRNALDQLEVKHLTHEAGRANAKGSVEGGNNLVETQFECRLKLEPVDNVDQLNAAVENWYNAFNSNSIAKQDTRLKRRGMTAPVARYGLWQMIRAEQLRLLPNPDICRALLAAKPESRQVSSNLCISFVHPKIGKSRDYSLAHCAGVLVGKKVQVSALFYSEGDIRVEIPQADKSVTVHHIQPVEYDNQTGMPANAPAFGEAFNAMPDTDVEKRKKSADRTAFAGQNDEQIKKSKAKQATPFDGQIRAHSFLDKAAAAAPTFMQKSGTQITPSAIPQQQEQSLQGIALKRWIMKRIFRDLTNAEIEWLNSFDQVMESELDSILQQIRNGVPQAPTLRVVNK